MSFLAGCHTGSECRGQGVAAHAIERCHDSSEEARQERREDIQFQVATVAESVMVEAAATALNTENATIADSKDYRQITQLPVNYRGATTSPLTGSPV
jgi:hypothetical protein